MRSMLEILEERGIKYEQVGERYRCLCPFHDDRKTPNLFIFADTNSFFCFSCEKSGTPVDFILNYDQCTLREALKRARVKDVGVRVKLKKRKAEDNRLEKKDFTEQVNLRISKLFRGGFKKLGSEKTFKLMQVLDRRIEEVNISYEEARKMTKAFKKKLEVE